MRVLTPVFILTLAGALASPAPAAELFVNPDGLCGGNVPCFTTIQAAIDAASPGDTIRVQAAVHSPAAKIDVHTSVTILGEQAGVLALPSQGSTRTPGGGDESIIDGAAGGLSGIIVITASDVTLDGLEIRNGSGDLIDSESSIPTSGTTIVNCIIHDASGDEGIQLRAVTDALIACNHVYDTYGDGINICCSSTGGVIEFNEVHDIGSDNAAIYIYSSTNTTIEGNLVERTTQNEGIKMGSKNGADAALSGGTIFNNTTVDTFQDGIAVYMSDVLVECNNVSGSLSENGGIYVAWPVSNVTIVNNEVHDNTLDTTKWGDPGGIMIGTDVNVATVTVQNNSIYNNTPNGVTNKAAGTLDATANWWGDPSGPGGAGPGLGDLVSTNVDFSGWLAAPAAFSCPALAGECGEGPVSIESSSWGRIKAQYR